ncbi:hypothetical protein [Flavobacterium sp. LB2P53]|uniref:hypothetical protein n=1 Tax=Flavobacterium sp. LB2P53 TaxID=2497481 RepID=UPI000F82A503|nr:hypothetical protein [Flavobacterium sp. LB2P53]RTY69692.1 hypothetical protein EKL95_05900 [Flavobacterium sp. LB2P53]
MNSPELNNYVQYVSRSGIVKAKSVVFYDDGEITTFEVSGINEDFFLLAVFQNNIQRYGIGFENFDNINMLSFLNSNVVDLGSISDNSFLNSEQVVVMSYSNKYVSFQKDGFLPNKNQDVKNNEYLFLKDYCIDGLNNDPIINTFSVIFPNGGSLGETLFYGRLVFGVCRVTEPVLGTWFDMPINQYILFNNVEVSSLAGALIQGYRFNKIVGGVK